MHYWFFFFFIYLNFFNNPTGSGERRWGIFFLFGKNQGWGRRRERHFPTCCHPYMHAEFAAIRHGLSIVKEFSAPLVIMETDSLEMIHLISKGDGTTHALGVLIDDIRKLLSNSPGYRFVNIFREVNQCVDLLIKMGSRGFYNLLCISDEPPQATSLLLLDYVTSTVFVRR